MIEIKTERVVSSWLESYLGLKTYARIMEEVRKTDVSSDAEFQKTFNGFYRVRRNEVWRSFYYDFFEKMKSEQNPCFQDILFALYDATGNVEASFASKMLATLKPEQPIWDQYVIKNLGLRVPASNRAKHIEEFPVIYAQIQKWYQEFLKTENARECISSFDALLPEYRWMTNVKKIDYYLWKSR